MTSLLFHFKGSINATVGERNEVGLTQGFLTSPFLCGQETPIGQWYDHDKRDGYALNYLGETNQFSAQAGAHSWGWDTHGGIDFDVPVGTTVVASAPGTVNWADYIPNEYRPLTITIDHFRNKEFATGSSHHSVLLVNVDDNVYRGQIIALSGKSGTSNSHVHYNVFHPHREVDGQVPEIDPFGVLYETDDDKLKFSQWTVHNRIVCPFTDGHN